MLPGIAFGSPVGSASISVSPTRSVRVSRPADIKGLAILIVVSSRRKAIVVDAKGRAANVKHASRHVQPNRAPPEEKIPMQALIK
jgi:hypothetical protein